jgi:hypothetical protein
MKDFLNRIKLILWGMNIITRQVLTYLFKLGTFSRKRPDNAQFCISKMKSK